MVIWALIYLVLAVREVTFLGPRLFWKTLALCPSRVFFLIACFLAQVALPFRLACQPVQEDRLALLIMLLTGPYFLFFCRYKHNLQLLHKSLPKKGELLNGGHYAIIIM